MIFPIRTVHIHVDEGLLLVLTSKCPALAGRNAMLLPDLLSLLLRLLRNGWGTYHNETWVWGGSERNMQAGGLRQV